MVPIFQPMNRDTLGQFQGTQLLTITERISTPLQYLDGAGDQWPVGQTQDVRFSSRVKRITAQHQASGLITGGKQAGGPATHRLAAEPGSRNIRMRHAVAPASQLIDQIIDAGRRSPPGLSTHPLEVGELERQGLDTHLSQGVAQAFHEHRILPRPCPMGKKQATDGGLSPHLNGPKALNVPTALFAEE